MKKNHPGVWLVLLLGVLTLSAAGLLVMAQDEQRSRRAFRRQFRTVSGEPELSTGELTAGDSLRVVTVGDRERRYLVHVPRGYNSDEPTPVIIAIDFRPYHGDLVFADSFLSFPVIHVPQNVWVTRWSGLGGSASGASSALATYGFASCSRR